MADFSTHKRVARLKAKSKAELEQLALRLAQEDHEIKKVQREVEQQLRESKLHIQHAKGWQELGNPVEALNELYKIPGLRAQCTAPRGLRYLRSIFSICRNFCRMLRKRTRAKRVLVLS